MWLDRKALTRAPTTAEPGEAGRARPRHGGVMPMPRPCPLSDAERARKHRRRERENLQNLNLDVPCVTINRLIDDGYLALEHAGDRRAVGRAIEDLLAGYSCGSLITRK